jgi:hypothetical protein
VKAWVAPNGVSALLGAGAPVLSASEWDEVFKQNHILVYGQDDHGGPREITYDYRLIRPGSVLAATLGRSERSP